ncbi:MAG: hypothetical protein Q7S96_00165 [bacterium]|nr:hypothetical protein [bacterium]
MPNKMTEERMRKWSPDDAMLAAAFIDLKTLNRSADRLKRGQAILRRAIETNDPELALTAIVPPLFW